MKTSSLKFTAVITISLCLSLLQPKSAHADCVPLGNTSPCDTLHPQVCTNPGVGIFCCSVSSSECRTPTPTPAPQTCTSITDPTTCASTPGCTYNNDCTTACSSIRNETECGYSPGCNWDGNSCNGTAQPPSYSTSGIGVFSQYVNSFNNVISPKIFNDLNTIPNIINALIPYLMIFAGLILFIMLLTGGFQMLMSGADPKQADAGKQRLTTAIVGFLIIVVAYWVTQIVQIVLGIKILN